MATRLQAPSHAGQLPPSLGGNGALVVECHRRDDRDRDGWPLSGVQSCAFGDQYAVSDSVELLRPIWETLDQTGIRQHTHARLEI